MLVFALSFICKCFEYPSISKYLLDLSREQTKKEETKMPPPVFLGSAGFLVQLDHLLANRLLSIRNIAIIYTRLDNLLFPNFNLVCSFL